MIQPVGNVPFDLAALAAERTRQAAEAQPNLTQAQATLAAKNYFVAVIAAGAANNVAVSAEQQALSAINSSGAP
jgi:hypothetical protein